MSRQREERLSKVMEDARIARIVRFIVSAVLWSAALGVGSFVSQYYAVKLPWNTSIFLSAYWALGVFCGMSLQQSLPGEKDE